MKGTKTLLISAIMILMAVVGINAADITIGTGTSASYLYGIDHAYKNSVVEAIYSAAELGAQREITAIALERNGGTGTGTIGNVKVYLKNSSVSELAASGTYDLTGYTMVYNDSLVTNSTTGWLTLNLITSFNYNGTDNLHVLIVKETADKWTTTTAPKFNYTSTSPVYRTRYDYDDASTNYSFTRTYSRPNIRITYTPYSMVLNALNTEHPTVASVKFGSSDVQILKTNVRTLNSLNALKLNAMNYNTIGTTNVSDITKARLYYTGNSNTFATTTPVGQEVIAPNGSFSFTDSVTLAEGNNYFWLVYDLSSTSTIGNLIDAGFESATVSNVVNNNTTNPAGARTIIGPLNGTYTVGTGNYTNLYTVFADINAVGISGDVNLVINSDINEPAPAVLNNILEEGAGNYKLTIRPDGVATRRVYGAFDSSAVILLNGADRVEINGMALNSSTAHQLIIENTNDTEGAAVWAKSLGADQGVNNLTIKNTVLKAGSQMSNTYGLLYSGAFSTSSPYNVDSDTLTIDNNIFEKAYYGMRINGESTTDYLTNVTVTNNKFGSIDSAQTIVYYDAYLYYTENALVSNNTFVNNNQYGLYLSSSPGATVSNNTFEQTNLNLSARFYAGIYSSSDDITVVNNNIKNFRYYGIYNSGSNAVIEYNTISDGISTSSSAIYGVYSSLAADENQEINKNKIYNIHNAYLSSSNGGASVAIYANGDADNTTLTPINITNNMIWNISSLGSTSSTAEYNNPIGIRYLGSAINMINNTIVLNPTLATTGNTVSACIFTSSTTNADIQIANNILVNKATSDAAAKNYAIFCYAAGEFTTINNNIYDVNSATNGHVGYIKGSTTAYDTKNDWVAVVTNDQNSKELTASLKTPVPFLDGGAVANSDYLSSDILTDTDFNDETREEGHNYIGADIVIPTSVTINSNMPELVETCAGAAYSLSIVPQINGFADGIERTTIPGDLSAMNYTWYHNDAEIAYDPNKTPEENGFFIVNRNQLQITESKNYHTGTYYAVVTLGTSSSQSTNATFAIEQPIKINGFTQNTVACETTPSFTMNVDAEGSILGYRWEKYNDATATYETIGTSSSPEFTVNIVSRQATAGKYRAVVIGPGNCGPAEVATIDNNVLIDLPVKNATIISSTENLMNLCENVELKFTASAEGDIAGYQWQILRGETWIDLTKFEFPTCNEPTLVIPETKVTNSGRYRVVVFGTAACNQFASAEIEFRAWEEFEFVKHPEDLILCENQTIGLKVIGKGEILAYQWKKDGVVIPVAENASADQPFFEIKNPSYYQSGAYSVVLTVKDCKGINQVESKPAEVYVMRATEITKQPSSTKAMLAGKAMFRVEAHHKGITPPSYKDKFQWFRYDVATNTSTELKDNARIAGAQSSVLTINNVEDADYTKNGAKYYVVVTGLCGEVVSAKADLEEGANVIIKSEPTAATVCEAANASFTIDAEATNNVQLVYQWMKDGRAIADNSIYTGTNTNTLNINAATTAEAGKYSVEVSYITNEAKATSQEAELVINLKPTIKTQPIANTTVQVGKDLELTVEAESKTAVTYQWKKDGNDIQGATNATYTKSAVDQNDAGKYTVVVKNDCGEIVSSESNVAVTTTQATSVSETADGSMRLFSVVPNPANSIASVSFELTNDAFASLSIIDMTGREVAVISNTFATKGINTFKFDVNSLELTNGVYFISLKSNANVLMNKFIVNK